MANNISAYLSECSSSDEDDQDPVMIAARLAATAKKQQRVVDGNVLWRYCTETVEPIEATSNEPALNLIALGRTGDGKSSLLNDLMSKQVFKQKISAKSQTKDIQSSRGFWAPLHPYMHNKETFGCHINVIDTPGFGDSQNRDQEFYELIQNAILDTATNKGGIHCILMVFKITTSSDTIFKSLEALYKLVKPYTNANEFWNNVLLVFTHVDIVNSNTNRYQSHKVALSTKVSKVIKEKYSLSQELPMLWISTQRYTCGYLKGLTSECDCEKGNRYHSDCRRRLFEQVKKRALKPFALQPIKLDLRNANDDVAVVSD